MSNTYKITFERLDGKTEKYIYGAEDNIETITKFVHTMDEIIGQDIDKFKSFKWEKESENNM